MHMAIVAICISLEPSRAEKSGGAGVSKVQDGGANTAHQKRSRSRESGREAHHEMLSLSSTIMPRESRSSSPDEGNSTQLSATVSLGPGLADYPCGRFQFLDFRPGMRILLRHIAQPRWRNWQTRQLEVLVGVKSRGGSSPLLGMRLKKGEPQCGSPCSLPQQIGHEDRPWLFNLRTTRPGWPTGPEHQQRRRH